MTSTHSSAANANRIGTEKSILNARRSADCAGNAMVMDGHWYLKRFLVLAGRPAE